jgi:hypothetical protein
MVSKITRRKSESMRKYIFDFTPDDRPVPRGIDYYIVTKIGDRSGCIDDPNDLQEFYRRIAAHYDFRPKLGISEQQMEAHRVQALENCAFKLPDRQ